MNVNAPISLVVAAYGDLDGAGRDFTTVWGTRADGDFHHTSIALLSRDLHDQLQVVLTDSTAKYLHWGGALIGGPVFLLAPTAGATLLSVSGLAGVGAILGHIRANADPVALADATGLLRASPTSLVVVAVNRRAADMATLLERATMTSTVDMTWGDLEEELSQDFASPLTEALLSAS
jgi:hypothetical protein